MKIKSKEVTYPRMVNNANDIRQFEIYQINFEDSERGTAVVVITPTSFSSNVTVVPFSKNKFRFDRSFTLSKSRLLNGAQVIGMCSQEEIDELTKSAEEYSTQKKEILINLRIMELIIS